MSRHHHHEKKRLGDTESKIRRESSLETKLISERSRTLKWVIQRYKPVQARLLSDTNEQNSLSISWLNAIVFYLNETDMGLVIQSLRSQRQNTSPRRFDRNQGHRGVHHKRKLQDIRDQTTCMVDTAMPACIS